MNIYALHDRLLDHWRTPFAAPTDKDVLASLSTTITREPDSDVAYAPHHFEIWKLGEVHEQTGRLEAKHEFIADCSTLVRARRQPSEPGERPIPIPDGRIRRPVDEAPNAPNAGQRTSA